MTDTTRLSQQVLSRFSHGIVFLREFRGVSAVGSRGAGRDRQRSGSLATLRRLHLQSRSRALTPTYHADVLPPSLFSGSRVPVFVGVKA